MSCTQSNKQTDKTSQLASKIDNIDTNKDMYSIETDNYLSTKNGFNLSGLFNHVKTVILETKKDVLIGNITSMQVYKDSIFILDNISSNGLFLFNKEGRFLKRYGNIGQGPGEYLKPTDFSLDVKSNKVYILDSKSQNILIYNLSSGSYINTIHIVNRRFKSYHIQYANGRIFADAYYFEKNKYAFLLQEINKSTGERINQWLPTKSYNKNYSEPLFASENVFYDRTQESPKFIQYFMDTVITIGHNKIMPLLSLKSNKLLKEVDLQDFNYRKDNIVMKFLLKDIVYHISNFCSYKNILYFTFRYKDLFECCIYNKNTKETQIKNMIFDDLVYKTHEGGSYLFPRFCTSNEDGMYAYIHPIEMKKFLELAKCNKLRPDLDKIDKLKQLTSESNPVIFIYQ